MTTMNAPAREGLKRSIGFEVTRADDDGTDGLTLEGYAAVFGTPTRIDSWEGSFDEQIAKGAFRKTISENTPVLQFDHGHHPLIGSIPIGTIKTLREEDAGLYVKARLTDNWLVAPVRDAIRDGAVSGMSFRFSVIRDEWRDNTGKLIKPDDLPRLLWDPGDRGPLQRTLKEVKMAELGPVVFPAYPETSVGVRGLEIARSLADPEIRRDLARALLLDSVEQQPPEDTEDSTPVEDEPREHSPSDDMERTDAPPSDGHPSTTDTDNVDRLRSNIREISGLMKEKLASITKDT